MPSEWRLNDLQKLLDEHGWRLARIAGSHHIFVKEGEEHHISVPAHRGRVKGAYAQRIQKRLGTKGKSES